MPKINVYLPDRLAAAARAARLPISEICQRALTLSLAGETPGTESSRRAGLPSLEERVADLERAAAALTFAQGLLVGDEAQVPAVLRPIGAAHAAGLIRTSAPEYREWEVLAQNVAGSAAAIAVCEELDAPEELLTQLRARLDAAVSELQGLSLSDSVGAPDEVLRLLAALTVRSHPTRPS